MYCVLQGRTVTSGGVSYTCRYQSQAVALFIVISALLAGENI